ncbi:GTP cyclohydrolase 1 feedback regulatory protein isoform X1 [Hippocampus zosterae]|uniref:GTP cyclohydrolase 1 feedback regulatory protein isoform X1 n=1 Tax=Hippocampus zosterae TaxID=109293 RepID=UPI00223D70AD|nr:GTP cyclohydrolase 1 feedback regulatory protein isoform X1 [Hippocampus zosterae]
MPYILVSTQIRLENGPTNVGDEYSDPDVMNYLGARKTTMLGNNFDPSLIAVNGDRDLVKNHKGGFASLGIFVSEYHVDEPPRLVLDKLEKIGYRMLTMTGVGQTLVWCLHKEPE